MGKIQEMVGSAEALTQLDRVGTQLVLIGSEFAPLSSASGCCGVMGFCSQTAISLAVAAVPEGLPTIATTGSGYPRHEAA